MHVGNTHIHMSPEKLRTCLADPGLEDPQAGSILYPQERTARSPHWKCSIQSKEDANSGWSKPLCNSFQKPGIKRSSRGTWSKSKKHQCLLKHLVSGTLRLSKYHIFPSHSILPQAATVWGAGSGGRRRGPHSTPSPPPALEPARWPAGQLQSTVCLLRFAYTD